MLHQRPRRRRLRSRCQDAVDREQGARACRGRRGASLEHRPEALPQDHAAEQRALARLRRRFDHPEVVFTVRLVGDVAPLQVTLAFDSSQFSGFRASSVADWHARGMCAWMLKFGPASGAGLAPNGRVGQWGGGCGVAADAFQGRAVRAKWYKLSCRWKDDMYLGVFCVDVCEMGLGCVY